MKLLPINNTEKNNTSFKAKLTIIGNYKCLNKEQINELVKQVGTIGHKRERIKLFIDEPRIVFENKDSYNRYTVVERQIKASGKVFGKDFAEAVFIKSRSTNAVLNNPFSYINKLLDKISVGHSKKY